MSCGCKTQLPIDGAEQLFMSSIDLMEFASGNYGYFSNLPISHVLVVL